MTLTTIPRASTPSVSGTTIGSSMTITTNRASSSFTHTLTYSIGSLSGTIATGVGASTTWTIPASLANAIPNATSGTLTINCTTYSGSTNIGSKSITCTISVPSSYVPSISSVSLSEAVSGIASKFGCYVQGKSKISGTVSASGTYSSTIKSYKITINGATYTSSTFTTGVLNTTGSNTCSVTVTDSRGRTASKSATFTVVAYSNPYITTFSVVRCNGDGTVSENGAYAKVVVKGGVSSVNSKNSYSYKLEYKTTSASSYTNYSISNSAYTIDKTYANISVSTDSSYDFRLTISDYFTSATKTISLSSVFQLMNYNSSGKGLAIGKVSEKDAFEVGMPAEFKGGISTPEYSKLTGFKYLGSGVDLNTIKTAGMYGVYQAVNAPSTGISTLEVIVYSADWILQRFTVISNPLVVYVRTFYNGTTWSGWTKELVYTGSKSNVNLDDYKTLDNVYFSSNCTNAPSGYCQTLILGNGGDCVQIAVGVSQNILYTRTYNSSSKTWTAWNTMPRRNSATLSHAGRPQLSASAWTAKTIDLNAVKSVGNDLSYSSNGIKCGRAMSCLVSANVTTWNCPVVTEFDVRIVGSTLGVVAQLHSNTAHDLVTHTIAPILVNAPAGEIFKVEFITGLAGTYTFIADSNGTHLTVQEV